jgi:hypothetical protein
MARERKVVDTAVETPGEMLRRLINFIEADPDCYEGDDGKLAGLVAGGKRAMAAARKKSKGHPAKAVTTVTVVDPDAQAEVRVLIFKEQSGAMGGVDESYVEQQIGPVISPHENGQLRLTGV